MRSRELEARNGYDETDHDPFFEAYAEGSITADDLALFPDYLVCIPPGQNDAPENAGLIDTLSSGLPVKVVVQVTDLLEEASIGTGHFAFGVRSARLATTAMGLGGMFVLQATSSSLYRLRQRVEDGMGSHEPALFSIFAGAPAAAGNLPRYLTAAAAMESRAFPAFVYDAGAGANWAERFSLEHNRNPDTDWPVEAFEYADEAMQRVRADVAFTYADFALCDRRHAQHFALVPRERWTNAMIPAGDWLALPERDSGGARPVSSRRRRAGCPAPRHRRRANDAGHTPLPAALAPPAGARRDPRFARRAASGAREGGVGGSEDGGAGSAAQVGAGRAGRRHRRATVAEAATPVEPAPMPRKSPRQTRRGSRPPVAPAATSAISSIRKCSPTTTTSRPTSRTSMRGPTGNSWKRPNRCQVAIIHPGKPRNPNEPGLEELMKRAEAFN